VIPGPPSGPSVPPSAGTIPPINVPQPGFNVPPSLPVQIRPVQQPVSVPGVPPPAPEAKKPVTIEESFVVGEEYEKTIASLMEMGFPRDQVVKALKAAYNNPARATDYLLSVYSYLEESIL
jgi:UV excision repair protein RAD23